MNRFLKLMRETGCVWMLFCLAGETSGRAQPATNSPTREAFAGGMLAHLSLASAQEIAFERNWDLLAAVSGVDAATAQKIVAHEFPNPTLAIDVAKINFDGHPNSTPSGNGLWDRSYDTIAAINQLIEIGGKRRSRQASAQAGFDGARAQLLEAKRNLDLGVAKAYVAAAQAQENSAVLRESAASLQEEARLAELRLRAGEISAADKSQIEITAERFEQDAMAAESLAAQARVALEVLLGAPRPEADCTLADRLEDLIRVVPAPHTNSTGLRRPDVVAAEAAARKADADLRLQKANRVPDPTLLGQYEHNPYDSPNSFGVGVSLPLPLWNRNRGNILAAEAAKEQARLAFDKARAQASADIEIALLAYEDAAKRWRNYHDNIRPKSEQIRKTKAYAYQKGGASLLDMLVAERDDNEVRLAALQAASDTAAAMAALQAATQEMEASQLKK